MLLGCSTILILATNPEQAERSVNGGKLDKIKLSRGSF